MEKLLRNNLFRVFLVVVLLSAASLVYSSKDKNSLPGAHGISQGTVSETFNAGGYTYIRLQIEDQEYWVAGPQTTVKTGQTVAVTSGFLMDEFYSKALDRTFKEIYFVGTIDAGQAEEAEGTSESGTRLVLDHSDVGFVEGVEGGYTVGEILQLREDLAGKRVRIRGRVVKYSGEIMNRHWYHLQDGTSCEEISDLTVTAADSVTSGDIILIEGTVAVDKDFGSGYFYPTIIEEAKVIPE